MIIKRHAEDFFVEEILSRETVARISAEPRPFALYRAAKRNLGTDEAIERIAARLRLSPGRIGYAGLKDKYAVTVQYISVDFPRGASARAPDFFEAAGVNLELVGWLERSLSADDIGGNRFRVTMRNLTRRESARVDEARAFLSSPSVRGKKLRFVNYYGEQRFGSARHGRGFAARRFIQGDFEGGLKLLIAVPDRKDSRDRKAAKRAIAVGWGRWKGLAETLPPCPESRVVERLAGTDGDFRSGFLALPRFIQQMTIEAYQSWLWNEIARRLVEERCRAPFLEAHPKFGAPVFPKAASIPAELSSLTIPLFAPDTELAAPWKAAAEEVLAGEGIAPSDLRIPGLRKPYFGEVPRMLFAEASEFSLGPVEPDEALSGERRFKRRARFFLRRGSYATVLLSALESAPGAAAVNAPGAGAQSILR